MSSDSRLSFVAQTILEQGYSILPLTEKRPAIGSWIEFQSRRATNSEIQSWFSRDDVTGIGVICGNVSNALMVVDFDDENIFHQFCDTFPHMTDKAIIKTKRGYHIYYHLQSRQSIKTQHFNGLDIIGKGGYVVGYRSQVDGHEYTKHKGGMPYTLNDKQLEQILDFANTLGSVNTAAPRANINQHNHNEPQSNLIESPVNLNQYIKPSADDVIAIYRSHLGTGRNNALFTAACWARDRGVSQTELLGVLLELFVYSSAHNHKNETEKSRANECYRTIASVYSKPARRLNHQPKNWQMVNVAREYFHREGLTAVPRTYDALVELGYRPGQTITYKQIKKDLVGIVGDWSIRKFLGSGIFAPPAPPLLPLAVLEGGNNATEYNAYSSPVQNQQKGRPTKQYTLPSNQDMCDRAGITYKPVCDKTDLKDHNKANTYRQALYLAWVDRKPAKRTNKHIQNHLGVSRWTVQRYNNALKNQIKIEPSWHETIIWFDNIDVIEDELFSWNRHTGQRLNIDGKHYPAKQAIALKYLLKRAKSVILQRRDANYYSTYDAIVYNPPSAPAPQHTISQPEPYKTVSYAGTPSAPAPEQNLTVQPAQITPVDHQKPQFEYNSEGRKVGKNRQYRYGLINEANERLAQRIYHQLAGDISLNLSRRIADTCDHAKIRHGLRVIRRQSTRNRVGLLITVCQYRSE